MTTQANVFSVELLEMIQTLPEVLEAKERIDALPSGQEYFNIQLTDDMKTALEARFSIDLSGITSIPMRWIKGDTSPHIDHGASVFDMTYLVYLNTSAGEFVINNTSYPITQNTGFAFEEGLEHSTRDTGTEARLLLGPMNEFAQPVGASVTFYYPTEADAVANTNLIAQYGSYQIIAVSGFQYWRIASTSTGPSPQNIVYMAGQTLDSTGSGSYYLYPSAPCFLEGTTILCSVEGVDTYIPIENLTKDSLVKTSRNGTKKIAVLGKGTIKNSGTSERTENRLYKCSPSKYPALTSELFITGCHSILEFPITKKQEEDLLRHNGKLFVTDKKYRLMAFLDERAEPWESEGTYTIYHFALEDPDDGINFGVYANGGLLVETAAIRTLKNRTNITILF